MGNRLKNELISLCLPLSEGEETQFSKKQGNTFSITRGAIAGTEKVSKLTWGNWFEGYIYSQNGNTPPFIEHYLKK